MSKKNEKVMVKPSQYDVLQAPVITEKSTMASEQGKVVFLVKMDATKQEIKSAVEAIFNVSVTKVNTLVVKGKTKVFRGRKGRRSDYKKAVVTLKDGQSVDMASGV